MPGKVRWCFVKQNTPNHNAMGITENIAIFQLAFLDKWSIAILSNLEITEDIGTFLIRGFLSDIGEQSAVDDLIRITAPFRIKEMIWHDSTYFRRWIETGRNGGRTY